MVGGCRLVDLEMDRIGQLRNEVFNVGGGGANSLSLVEATRFFEHRFGRSIEVSRVESPRKADTAIYITDNRKVERVLGWKPQVSLNEGLDSIAAWVRQNEAELSERYRLGE